MQCLHDWQVVCFVITCVSCLGLHIQCDWLVLAWQAMLQSSLVHVRILLGRPTAAERLHFHFIFHFISISCFSIFLAWEACASLQASFYKMVWWNSQGISQGLHLGICREVSAMWTAAPKPKIIITFFWNHCELLLRTFLYILTYNVGVTEFNACFSGC